jgi:hypothetical protein
VVVVEEVIISTDGEDVVACHSSRCMYKNDRKKKERERLIYKNALDMM